MQISFFGPPGGSGAGGEAGPVAAAPVPDVPGLPGKIRFSLAVAGEEVPTAEKAQQFPSEKSAVEEETPAGGSEMTLRAQAEAADRPPELPPRARVAAPVVGTVGSATVTADGVAPLEIEAVNGLPTPPDRAPPPVMVAVSSSPAPTSVAAPSKALEPSAVAPAQPVPAASIAATFAPARPGPQPEADRTIQRIEAPLESRPEVPARPVNRPSAPAMVRPAEPHLPPQGLPIGGGGTAQDDPVPSRIPERPASPDQILVRYLPQAAVPFDDIRTQKGAPAISPSKGPPLDGADSPDTGRMNPPRIAPVPTAVPGSPIPQAEPGAAERPGPTGAALPGRTSPDLPPRASENAVSALSHRSGPAEGAKVMPPGPAPQSAPVDPPGKASGREARQGEQRQPGPERSTAVMARPDPVSSRLVSGPVHPVLETVESAVELSPERVVDSLDIAQSGASGRGDVAHRLGEPDIRPAMLARGAVAQVAEAIRLPMDGSIELRLSPEELGRVKLSIAPGEAGLVVQLVAERPETLDLLRRHVDLLADDLRDLGYSGLEFSFSQEGGDHPDTDRSVAPPARNIAEPVHTSGPARLPPPGGMASGGGLDIRL